MTNVDHDGDDHRRAMPPVDPWMGPAPYPPGLLPVEPVPDDLPPTPPPATPPQRRGRWLVAAAAAVVLLACLGGALLSSFDDAPDRAVAPATPAVTSTAPASTAPVVLEVVYLVSSTGEGDRARVEFTDEDRDIVRKGEVTLPWRHTFRVIGDRPPLVVIAQRTEGGTGPVTCSITVNGKELTTAVHRGRSAAPQCSA